MGMLFYNTVHGFCEILLFFLISLESSVLRNLFHTDCCKADTNSIHIQIKYSSSTQTYSFYFNDGYLVSPDGLK